jgi:hypothetical protein
MKEIPLTQGKIAIVDDEEYELFIKYKWCVGGGYARRNDSFKGKRITLQMHRVITNCPMGFEVDHIDGDKLNNRKDNLRVVNHRGNMQNRHVVSDTSSFPGVSYDVSRQKWRAVLHIGGVQKQCGRYDEERNAAQAYIGGLFINGVETNA